jgi:transposase InsO family protein
LDHGIAGEYVTRLLGQAGQFRGFPAAVRTDQARQEIARWQRDYNEVRPHSSIGRIDPHLRNSLQRVASSMAMHCINRRSIISKP